MRKDVNILINSKTSQVMLNQRRLGLNYENLQGKIIVTFDDNFVDGIAYLEIERNGEKGYLLMTKENEAYTLEIKSSLLNVAGQINMQVRITESEQDLEIPVWKSNVFYLMVEKAINSTTEIPDEYPSWIDTANAKLQEMDNLNIEAEKVGHTTTITITGKDGSENSVDINDGEAGEQGPAGPVGPVGPAGRDGAIQYTAGDNITIENNVISADFDGDQYYTKAETNELLSNKQDALPIYFVKARSSNTVIEFSYSSAALILNSADVPQFVDIVKDMLAKNKTSAILMFSKYYGSEYELHTITITGTIESGTGKLQFRKIYNSNNTYYQYGFNNDGHRVGFFTLPITYSNDEITGFGQSTYTQANDTYLSTRNTYEYTPTADYHPATKKYVDDHAGGVSLPIYSATISASSNISFQSGNISLVNADKQSIGEAIKQAVTDGWNQMILAVTKTNTNMMLININLENLDLSLNGNQTVTLYRYPNTKEDQDMFRYQSGVAWYGTLVWTLTVSNGEITNIIHNSATGQTKRFLDTTNTKAYTPTANYHPSTKKYVDDLALIESITNSNATYTIASLVGNKSYKLGEITSLTITASTASDYESVIYFSSGSTPTEVTMPNTITNLGDAPTASGGVMTCTANKNYIIAVLNNIAVWKEY